MGTGCFSSSVFKEYGIHSSLQSSDHNYINFFRNMCCDIHKLGFYEIILNLKCQVELTLTSVCYRVTKFLPKYQASMYVH